MNKRNMAIVEAYENSEDYELYNVYGSYSQAKASAWEHCKRVWRNYIEKYGWDNITSLKVISANGWRFTAGFEYDNHGDRYLVYITKSGDTEIKIEEEK